MEAKTITIDVRGQERVFTLRSNIPLRLRNWWEDMFTRFQASPDYNGIESPEKEETASEAVLALYMAMVRFICRHPDLVAEGIASGYVGDHSGVDWSGEIDGSVTATAISDLCMHFFTSAAAKRNESLTSSPNTPTPSEATAAADGSTTSAS